MPCNSAVACANGLLAPSETFAATDDRCSATGRFGPRRRGPYLSPPVVVVWAWLVFGEPLSWGDGGRIGRISRRSHHRGATAGGRELTGRQRARFDDPNVSISPVPRSCGAPRAPNGGNQNRAAQNAVVRRYSAFPIGAGLKLLPKLLQTASD